MLAALGLTIGGALVSPLVADPATLDRVLSDRPYYWWAAWHAIPDYAPLGSGAGTFAVLWGERAPVPRDVLDGHSLYLEALAELGPVGLVVLLTALATPMLAAMRSSPAWPVAAAAGAYGAFLVHAGLDWDWEMPAVTIAGLACGAALLAGEATARPTRVGGRSIAGGAAVLLAAAITSRALSG
jgi:O-antigen ligase